MQSNYEDNHITTTRTQHTKQLQKIDLSMCHFVLCLKGLIFAAYMCDVYADNLNITLNYNGGRKRNVTSVKVTPLPLQKTQLCEESGFSNKSEPLGNLK